MCLILPICFTIIFGFLTTVKSYVRYLDINILNQWSAMGQILSIHFLYTIFVYILLAGHWHTNHIYIFKKY